MATASGVQNLRLKRRGGEKKDRGRLAKATAPTVADDSSKEEVFSRESLVEMPVPELRGICRARRLRVAGTKDELVERILVDQTEPMADEPS